MGIKPGLMPNLHIICGKCGCNHELEFVLHLDGSDNGKYIYPAVFITCKNCGTLSSLDESVEDKTDWKKLKLTKEY